MAATSEASADDDITTGTEGSSFTGLLTSTRDPLTEPDDSGATTSSASSGITYSVQELCGGNAGDSIPSSMNCSEPPGCGNDGEMVRVWAHHPDGTTTLAGYSCQEPRDPIASDVLTPGRLLEAFQRVDLPEAPLEVQPPGGVTLVNFDTILHTDAQPFTETVQLLNRQITFDIEPSEFTWTLGDGRTLTTPDPGRAWRAGLPMDEYVSHRYAEAGSVRLQLTTTWSARWRLPNGPWRPVADTVQITSPPQQLEVTTARPQLVSYD